MTGARRGCYARAMPRTLLAAAGLSSCITLGRQGFIEREGTRRAAFEMKCGEDQLTTVGVEGCGQSVVYKWVQTSQYGYEWVRN